MTTNPTTAELIAELSNRVRFCARNQGKVLGFKRTIALLHAAIARLESLEADLAEQRERSRRLRNDLVVAQTPERWL